MVFATMLFGAFRPNVAGMLRTTPTMATAVAPHTASFAVTTTAPVVATPTVMASTSPAPFLFTPAQIAQGEQILFAAGVTFVLVGATLAMVQAAIPGKK